MIIDPQDTNTTQTTNSKAKSFKNALVTPVPLNNMIQDIEMAQQAEELNGVLSPGILSADRAISKPSANYHEDDMEPDHITLTNEEKQRIYKPWSYSIIVKLIGRKLRHRYLKCRVNLLWRPTEEIILIDLGSDYFTVKFLKRGKHAIGTAARTVVHKWFFSIN